MVALKEYKPLAISLRVRIWAFEIHYLFSAKEEGNQWISRVGFLNVFTNLWLAKEVELIDFISFHEKENYQ